jgi:serine/threonine protein kinase
MEIDNIAEFSDYVLKLGVITQPQLNDALEEARQETGRQTPELIFLTRTLERKGFMTNFQTGKVIHRDVDGFFYGGYRVLYKISSGSFGRVFRADDPRTGRVVAVKVLRRRWSEDQQRIDLFIREGKVGLTLKHPNIVEVLAINQEPVSRQYYIVMEFVEGDNLRELLKIQKTFTNERALRVLEDTASGLAYAYSRGITHRDIKLTNVLISSTTQEAKLVDFGLAQMFAAIGKESEQVDRTVDYAGLEKATDVKQGDVRSDIFFLGCIFFEMLTGRPPLSMSKDRHARMRPQRFQEVQSLRPGEIDASPAMYQLCETMLAYDPRRRYQTPSQLVEAVKAARREIAIPTAHASPGSVSRPAATRSVFIAESNTRMQDVMREKFKKLGYRPLIASDPVWALDRFRQQPFDALIMDVGTVGEDGLTVFDTVMQVARDKRVPCVGVVVLSEEQAELAERVDQRQNVSVMVMPVTIKQLHLKLQELMNGKG